MARFVRKSNPHDMASDDAPPRPGARGASSSSDAPKSPRGPTLLARASAPEQQALTEGKAVRKTKISKKEDEEYLERNGRVLSLLLSMLGESFALVKHLAQIIDGTDFGEFAESMYQVSSIAGTAGPMLAAFLDLEFARKAEEPNTILREMSVCTKFSALFTKDECRTYMDEVLAPLLEVQNKMAQAMSTELSEQAYLLMVKSFFHQIANPGTVASMPRRLRAVTYLIGKTAEQYVPDRKHIMMAGFLFLRVINPALITAKVHGLIKAENPVLQKQLIFVTQALQHLSNNTKWTKYPLISKWNEEAIPKMTAFLNVVASDSMDPPFADIFSPKVRTFDMKSVDCDVCKKLVKIMQSKRKQIKAVRRKISESGTDAQLVAVYTATLDCLDKLEAAAEGAAAAAQSGRKRAPTLSATNAPSSGTIKQRSAQEKNATVVPAAVVVVQDPADQNPHLAPVDDDEPDASVEVMMSALAGDLVDFTDEMSFAEAETVMLDTSEIHPARSASSGGVNSVRFNTPATVAPVSSAFPGIRLREVDITTTTSSSSSSSSPSTTTNATTNATTTTTSGAPPTFPGIRLREIDDAPARGAPSKKAPPQLQPQTPPPPALGSAGRPSSGDRRLSIGEMEDGPTPTTSPRRSPREGGTSAVAVPESQVPPPSSPRRNILRRPSEPATSEPPSGLLSPRGTGGEVRLRQASTSEPPPSTTCTLSKKVSESLKAPSKFRVASGHAQLAGDSAALVTLDSVYSGWILFRVDDTETASGESAAAGGLTWRFIELESGVMRVYATEPPTNFSLREAAALEVRLLFQDDGVCQMELLEGNQRRFAISTSVDKAKLLSDQVWALKRSSLTTDDDGNFLGTVNSSADKQPVLLVWSKASVSLFPKLLTHTIALSHLSVSVAHNLVRVKTRQGTLFSLAAFDPLLLVKWIGALTICDADAARDRASQSLVVSQAVNTLIQDAVQNRWAVGLRASGILLGFNQGDTVEVNPQELKGEMRAAASLFPAKVPTLLEMLSNPTYRRWLFKWSLLLCCPENVKFYTAVENIANFDSVGKKAAGLKRLAKEYLAPDGANALSISAAQQRRVLEQVANAEKRGGDNALAALVPDVLVNAQKEVVQLMEFDLYPSFAVFVEEVISERDQGTASSSSSSSSSRSPLSIPNASVRDWADSLQELQKLMLFTYGANQSAVMFLILEHGFRTGSPADRPALCRFLLDNYITAGSTYSLDGVVDAKKLAALASSATSISPDMFQGIVAEVISYLDAEVLRGFLLSQRKGATRSWLLHK